MNLLKLCALNENLFPFSSKNAPSPVRIASPGMAIYTVPPFSSDFILLTQTSHFISAIQSISLKMQSERRRPAAGTLNFQA